MLAALAALAGFGATRSSVAVPVDLLLFAGLAGLVLASARWDFALPWTPLLWPMLLFGALVAAQWGLGWSVYPGATITGLVPLAACGAIFYLALFGFAEPQCLRRLGPVLSAVTGIVAAEAILQYLTADKRIYWFHAVPYANPMGPFVYYNHYAGCMDLLVPVAVAAVFARAHRNEEPWLLRLRMGLMPLLAIASVILSTSRGGFLTLVFEGLLAGLLVGPGLRRRLRGWALVTVTGSAALFGLVVIRWGPLLSRFHHFTSDPDVVDRFRLAQSCLAIFRDHRWIGAGFNTFASIYPRYALFDNSLQWMYAHNEYAQLLGETGLFGALCALAVVALLAHGGWRCHVGRQPARRLRLGLFIGMAGLAFHSVMDFQFHAPANALLFFLFAGAAIRVPKPAADSQGGTRRRRPETHARPLSTNSGR